MAKTPISELPKAIEAVRGLQVALGDHERAIGELADRMARLEKRLDEMGGVSAAKPA